MTDSTAPTTYNPVSANTAATRIRRRVGFAQGLPGARGDAARMPKTAADIPAKVIGNNGTATTPVFGKGHKQRPRP